MDSGTNMDTIYDDDTPTVVGSDSSSSSDSDVSYDSFDIYHGGTASDTERERLAAEQVQQRVRRGRRAYRRRHGLPTSGSSGSDSDDDATMDTGSTEEKAVVSLKY